MFLWIPLYKFTVPLHLVWDKKTRGYIISQDEKKPTSDKE